MHNLLKQIIDINQQMLQLLNNNSWDEILMLSAKREQKLKEYFTMSPLPDTTSVIENVIEQVKRSDDKISQVISSEKNKSINESLSLKRSHSAIKNYQTAEAS